MKKTHPTSVELKTTVETETNMASQKIKDAFIRIEELSNFLYDDIIIVVTSRQHVQFYIIRVLFLSSIRFFMKP